MAVAPVPAAIITLKTRQIGTMRAIYLGPEVLVESECKPGTWYRVEGQSCSCPGNVYHGHCKHVSVAETAAMIERREAEPVTDLVWGGNDYGWVPKDEAVRRANRHA